MIVLGRLSLTLALVFCLASVVFLALGMRWDRKDLIRNGYYAVYGFFLTTVVASAVLLQAFLKKDFSFAYVAENSDASLSTFYRIAGFWAGQQGSFLLWLLLIAVVVVVIALADLNRVERLTGGAVMVLGIVGAVFAALMVLDTGSDPFTQAAAGTQPFGLNPLLLHPAMVLHPPALFIGYVGLAVPFAFADLHAAARTARQALGAARAEVDRRGLAVPVARHRPGRVVGLRRAQLRRLLGLGPRGEHVAGAVALGDGPAARLHALQVARPLQALGSGPGRGDVLLHHPGDVDDALGPHQLRARLREARAARLDPLHVPRGHRGRQHRPHRLALAPLREPRGGRVAALDGSSSTTSRTCCSSCSPWRWPRPPSSRGCCWTVPSAPSTYDAIGRPLGVVVLALIAICPLLAWRKTEGAQLRKTLILPGVTALLSVPLWLALGFQSNVWGFIGLVVCGFAFGAVIQFVLRAARRAAGPSRSLWSGLGRAFTGSRTRTAAYVVHFGMVLIVAGLIGSSVYKQESAGLVSTKAGSKNAVFRTDDGTYALKFTGMRENTGAQDSVRTLAAFDVLQNGTTRLGTVEPHTDVYPVSGAAVRAVILGRPFEDVFVVADEPFDSTSKTIALRVVVFPLIRWVWIGSILLCVGAVVSLWPKGRTQEQEARAAARDEGRGAGADRATA